MRLPPFFFFTALVFCFCLSAQQELTLAELIDIALKNNPETTKVWAQVKRAQAVLGESKNPLYPHLDAQGSVTRAREVKFPNGSDTTYTSYGGEVNLNYLL